MRNQTITSDEIIRRMQAGEVLRFVPRYISGDENDKWMGSVRDCWLGRQKLSTEESESIITLSMSGMIESKQDCIGVLAYKLTAKAGAK